MFVIKESESKSVKGLLDFHPAVCLCVAKNSVDVTEAEDNETLEEQE